MTLAERYAGETDGKKICRAALYQNYRKYYRALPAPGWAVVLAGREAADVRILTSDAVGIRWPKERILAVDIDEANVDVARRAGATGFVGDVRNAIRSLSDRSVAFVNLDLMGHWGPVYRESLELLRMKACASAFVSVTYARGRERMNALAYREGDSPVEMTKAAFSRGKVYGRFSRRALNGGHEKATGMALRRFGDWAMQGLWEYQSTSPMGVVSMFNLPPDLSAIEKFEGWYFGAGTEWGAKMNTSALEIRRDLRRFAIDVAEDEGVDAASDLLNIAPRTLIAWKAHRTAGTYGRADGDERAWTRLHAGGAKEDWRFLWRLQLALAPTRTPDNFWEYVHLLGAARGLDRGVQVKDSQVRL